MSSPEQRNHPKPEPLNEDLLAELEALNEAIEPYLETALAVDEIHKYEQLLEERDWILDQM